MNANRRLGALCKTFAVACVIGSASLVAHAQDGGVAGDWITADGSTRVRFESCGRELCGRIVWLREPVDPATRQPWRDGKNENAELRSRPLIGLSMLTDLKPDGAAAWSGSLYNPLDGKTYSGSLKKLDVDRLELSGCVLAIVCQTEIWKKSR